ncbi:MAG TPA: flagellar basal body-associated FliL family protein [Blastocatellia bacterium]|nr:flagellar basal body-associated FliL family protein [Blastocatellia bacterium]
MSNASTEHAESGGKKGSKMMIIIIAAVLLLGGGGAAGYFFVWKGKASAEEEKGKEKEKEKGKKKHGEDDEEEKDSHEEEGEDGEHAKEGEHEGAGEGEHEEGEKKSKPKPKFAKISLPDDSEVKQVIELQPYIVNLADKDAARYLRLTVSVGVGEGGEEKPSPVFITRVRNAMLAVLTTKSSDEVLTSEGKAQLRKELLKAARQASKEPEVQAIYITEFIVQL